MMMDLGQMNRVLDLQAGARQQGSNGEISHAWTSQVTLRARQLDKSSVLKYLGDEESNVNKVFFVIHYRNDLSTGSTRLVDEAGQVYEITGTRQLDLKNGYSLRMWLIVETKATKQA